MFFINKVQMCNLAVCQEKRLSGITSGVFVTFGFLITAVMGSVKYFGSVAAMQNEIVKFEAHWLPYLMIGLLFLLSIFVSQLERFDHWFSAFLCGASVPGLLVVIAVISVPDIKPQPVVVNPLPEVVNPLPGVLKP